MSHFPRIHPLTGEPIRPLGVTKRGQIIWPVLGGSQPTGAPAPAAPPATPPAAPPAPAAPAAPVYTPPADMAPPAAPAGPVYAPPIAQPTAPPADPASEGKDWSKVPAWAREEHEKLKSEAAQRRISERTALVNQHAYIAAGQLGVNPAALLASIPFAELAKGLSPTDADFPAKLTAAINETVKANPWMAAAPAAPATAPPATPPAPPASGGDFAAGNQAGVPITEAQLKELYKTRAGQMEIAKLTAEGKLKHLM